MTVHASAPCDPPSGARRARRVAALSGALAAALLMVGAVWAAPGKQEAKQAQESKPAEAPAAADNKPAEYVGSEACQACHEDIYKGFQKDPHAAIEKSTRKWGRKGVQLDGKGCESCHGPGSKHAESVSAADILNPAKQAANSQSDGCLNCHLNQPTQVGRLASSHARNQVSCLGCHGFHKGREKLVARNTAPINKQCASCHQDVWASFQRPHRHPLNERGMSCVDCHNPHGSFLPKQVRTVSANEPNCFRCHGDKRGPFVFEHAPVRLEGCSTCHEPHGSANPRMLTRHEVRNQCLECHTNLPSQPASGGVAAAGSGQLGGIPPGLHDMTSPRFRNCTVCHMKIHGSQVNRDFLR